jgi:hypothetical protein
VYPGRHSAVKIVPANAIAPSLLKPKHAQIAGSVEARNGVGRQMTRTKALLLGCVAGIAVATGAQAADLPVKAKPVQYVKICTLYGDGYYYIPGSDTCIRFGGYVRADYGYQAGGGTAGSGIAPGTQLTVTDGLMNRSRAQYSTAHRADLMVNIDPVRGAADLF